MTIIHLSLFLAHKVKIAEIGSGKRKKPINSPFMIFPNWHLCWNFTLLRAGRQHRGLLDKHPTLSRSAKHHCYCWCLMPSTSIVVLEQSTHTYVIKLRGSGTIQAIVL